jgi:hypothetical protein
MYYDRETVSNLKKQTMSIGKYEDYQHQARASRDALRAAFSRDLLGGCSQNGSTDIIKRHTMWWPNDGQVVVPRGFRPWVTRGFSGKARERALSARDSLARRINPIEYSNEKLSETHGKIFDEFTRMCLDDNWNPEIKWKPIGVYQQIEKRFKELSEHF